LIAATNHPELLDRAIWRRFDVIISLELPDDDARRRILEDDIASALGTPRVAVPTGAVNVPIPSVALQLCALVMEGASGSDLARFVRATLREAALSGSAPGDAFVAAALRRLSQPGVLDAGLRERVARLFVQELGWTQRATGELLGVSHVTVGNWLRERARGDHRGEASVAPPARGKRRAH
jgi:hypothetical protein